MLKMPRGEHHPKDEMKLYLRDEPLFYGLRGVGLIIAQEEFKSGEESPHSKTQARMELNSSATSWSAAIIRRFGIEGNLVFYLSSRTSLDSIDGNPSPQCFRLTNPGVAANF
jgi:hypothetical protein